jgi:hypothetical protein
MLRTDFINFWLGALGALAVQILRIAAHFGEVSQ